MLSNHIGRRAGSNPACGIIFVRLKSRYGSMVDQLPSKQPYVSSILTTCSNLLKRVPTIP